MYVPRFRGDIVVVKTGIDGISLTFNEYGFNLVKLSEFLGVDPTQFIRLEKSKLSFYRLCYQYGYEMNGKNTVLVSYFTAATSLYGKRDLVQIHGLCFSDSALNMFRPFSITKLVDFAIEAGANVTGFDVYLDDYTAAISQQKLNEMSQPHTFENFIQSPFLKEVEGEKPEPRYFKGTWYYGKNKSNACEITTYNKGISPRQQVHSKANPLKFTWQRYELRFTGDTARKRGQQLLADLASGKNLNQCVIELFRKYLRFVVPNPHNKRKSDWKLQVWYSRLLDLAEHC